MEPAFLLQAITQSSPAPELCGILYGRFGLSSSSGTYMKIRTGIAAAALGAGAAATLAVCSIVAAGIGEAGLRKALSEYDMATMKEAEPGFEVPKDGDFPERFFKLGASLVNGLPPGESGAKLVADLYKEQCYLEPSLSDDCLKKRIMFKGKLFALYQNCDIMYGENGKACSDFADVITSYSLGGENSLLNAAIGKTADPPRPHAEAAHDAKPQERLKAFTSFLKLENNGVIRRDFLDISKVDPVTGAPAVKTDAFRPMYVHGCYFEYSVADGVSCYRAGTDFIPGIFMKNNEDSNEEKVELNIRMLKRAVKKANFPDAAVRLAALYSGKAQIDPSMARYIEQDPGEAEEYKEAFLKLCPTEGASAACSRAWRESPYISLVK